MYIQNFPQLTDHGNRSLRGTAAEIIDHALSGADPYAGDQLGRLALSKEGLAQRDRLVLKLCRGAGLPVAAVMSGGYGRQVKDTVGIHLGTVRIAAEMARGVDGRGECG